MARKMVVTITEDEDWIEQPDGSWERQYGSGLVGVVLMTSGIGASGWAGHLYIPFGPESNRKSLSYIVVSTMSSGPKRMSEMIERVNQHAEAVLAALRGEQASGEESHET